MHCGQGMKMLRTEGMLWFKVGGSAMPSGDTEEIRLVDTWGRRLDRVMGVILTESWEHFVVAVEQLGHLASKQSVHLVLSSCPSLRGRPLKRVADGGLGCSGAHLWDTMRRNWGPPYFVSFQRQVRGFPIRNWMLLEIGHLFSWCQEPIPKFPFQMKES